MVFTIWRATSHCPEKNKIRIKSTWDTTNYPAVSYYHWHDSAAIWRTLSKFCCPTRKPLQQ